MWPKVILFGDSLTQRSFDPEHGCWGSLLANRLQRIADVVPRGFSGYNSRWCRILLPDVLSEFNPKQIACITILLGTNDSVPESSPTGQFVPVNEYAENMGAMIDFLESIGINHQKVILISPPNFHKENFDKWSLSNNKPVLPDEWKGKIEAYVSACEKVASDKKVSFLNLYEIFVKTEDSSRLFNDGLHFSRDGAQLLYDSLSPLVFKRLTEFTGKSLENSMQYPYWMDVDKEHPEKSLK